MGVSADQWLSPERHIGSKAVIGDRLRTDGKPMRDMVDTQGKVLFKAPESTKAMEPCAAQTPANDHCHVHDNSGISNRAWSLMTLGGVHKSSNLTFSSPLGWVKSRVLWYETFTRLSSQATFREAALKQLAWAAQFDPSILNTVGCAWYAVGALTLDATVSPLAASLVCPTAAPGVDGSAPPAPSGPPTTSSGACSGHANGWMCDPAAPSAAYRCNGGAAAGTVSCADLAERCKPRSVTDPTATVDSSGVLTCE